jgi:phosphoribosylglycinamide formyltransferase-1
LSAVVWYKKEFLISLSIFSDRGKFFMALKIAWFTTARDQAALELLETVRRKKEEGFLDLDIPVVFVSRDYGEGEASDRFLDWVQAQGIPLTTFSALRFQPEKRKNELQAWRLAYDQEVIRRLEPFAFDWILLAGYMWIVSPLLIERFPIINLHPAPPGGLKGSWQEVIRETILQRLPEAGAQIHLVTEALDEGPALTYATFTLNNKEWEPYWSAWTAKVSRSRAERIFQEEGEGEPFFARLREKELELEFPLIVWTLKTLASGRLQVKDRKVYWDGRLLPRGYCLNQEIFSSRDNMFTTEAQRTRR